jgi:DNA-binding CsgD family transcriptional regulator/tetratricopeptide (TPR) repeat protein
VSVSAGAASHVLLEREDELERLGRLTADAARGRGAAVVVEGPAGIGKTSLLEAEVRLAGAARLDVLTARGGELERDFAYGVVRQLLERHLGRASRQQRERWMEGAAALAGPVLGLAPEQHVGDDPTGAALHGLYWLVANLSAETPLLVAVDDLHWVDSASLRFLAYLARRVGELPILLLAASRPPVESHTPELVAALGADPSVSRVEPAPLSLTAVRDLVTRRGRADLAESVHAGTAGNPFLVEALLDVLDERLTADDVPVVGARSVIRFVAGRLDRIGPDAQALARAVAVLGTDAEPRHAYAIAELTDDTGGKAEDALVAAGILAARRPLEFVHPVVRTAVAEQLSPPERARRHLAAAHLLERDGGDAERLAPHLLAADARADAWVVETLAAAAERSIAHGAPDAAVRYLRRALDEPPSADARPALLAQLGRAELRAAMPDDAVEHLRAAMSASTSPRERAVMAHDLAIGLIAPGRYAEAVDMLEQAVESARPVDVELSRRLEAELLCAARLDAGTLPIARRVHDSLPADLPDDSPGARMLVAAVAHERALRGGTAGEVRTLAARALDGGLIAEQTGDSGLVMDAGFAAITAGDLQRADHCWNDALADVRRRGSVIGFARTSCLRAMLRLAQGRLLDAESDARNAITAAWEPGYRVARMAHGPLVEALVAQGDLVAAEAALTTAGLDGDLADNYMLNFVLFARGKLRLAQGRDAQGIADLEELGRRETKWRGSNPAIFPYRSLLALAGVPHAADLAAEELELARTWGAAGALGRALRAHGLVAADLDDLHESVEVLAGSPWRLEHAHSLIELGAATRRDGHRTAAREPLHAGMELAHACAAEPLVTRARAELVATGARPRRMSRSGIDALTASERRVVDMAAGGLTNRQIAQALFVTSRTVEVHLTHAYQKLDITSREQLPALLTPEAQ